MPDLLLIVTPFFIFILFIACLAVGDKLKMPDSTLYILLFIFLCLSIFYVRVVYAHSTSEWQTKEQVIV